MKREISQCPACDAALQVTELSCTRCDTRLKGTFPAPPLARLPEEHQRFIEVFLRCRGVIRDVERALGISYPTVRARLDAAVTTLDGLLDAPTPPSVPGDERRCQVLRDVAEGRIDASQAAETLKRLGGKG